MHVPDAPPGTHPIGNYHAQLDPHTGVPALRVQCAGRWHAVRCASADEARTLLSLLHSPFACVQDGWIVGRRAPEL